MASPVRTCQRHLAGINQPGLGFDDWREIYVHTGFDSTSEGDLQYSVCVEGVSGKLKTSPLHLLVVLVQRASPFSVPQKVSAL
ncbi:hypothetical protein E2C01_005977 [Portunus trituberculatus]|uniref:Uncharacterized protein n=1 Tax=Portunus trituberculatus TaxID=210409 RepID=A0A5B7CWM3_PORTR|nr:hypothetical protein [Portunus trituberculatus]